MRRRQFIKNIGIAIGTTTLINDCKDFNKNKNINNYFKKSTTLDYPSITPEIFASDPNGVYSGRIDATNAFQQWIANIKSSGLGFASATGTYRLSSNGEFQEYGERTALYFKNFKDLVIDLRGAKFIITGKSRDEWVHALRLDNCENLKIYSPICDYENEPFIQGSCVAKDYTSGSEHVDFEIDTINFSVNFDDVQRIEEFHPNDNGIPVWKGSPLLWNKGGGEAGRKIIHISGSTYRVDLSNDASSVSDFIVGNRYLLTHQIWGAEFIHARNCQNIEIVGGYVRCVAGKTWQFLNCENIALKDITVDRSASKKYRWRAASADGIAVLGCRGDLRVEGAKVAFTGDDPINARGFGMNVSTRNSDTKFSAGLEFPYLKPRIGDLIEIYDSSFKIVSSHKISSISFPSESTADVTVDSSLPWKLNNSYRIGVYSTAPCIKLDNFACLSVRGRILLQGLSNEIVNPRMEKASGGLYVAFDESMHYDFVIPRQISIQSGFFDDAEVQNSPGAVRVIARDSEGNPIKILPRASVQGTYIHECQTSGIYMAGVKSGAIIGNTLSKTTQTSYSKLHNGLADADIGLDSCKDIVVTGNTRIDKIGKIEIVESNNIKIFDNPKMQLISSDKGKTLNSNISYPHDRLGTKQS